MLRALLVLLVLSVAGWMIFDGTHALVTGDYVTPKSGEYAGKLGPWAALLETAGVDPRSTPVKVGFIAYGLVYLAFLIAFLMRRGRAWHGLVVCASIGLLYLVAGTVLNALVLVLLLRSGRFT